MGHENICILWFGVFTVPCYAVLHCLCQAMYASFYSTPTLRGSKTDGQPQIIVVNEMLRWRKEVMAERAVLDEEKDGGSEMQDHAKQLPGNQCFIVTLLNDICLQVTAHCSQSTLQIHN